MESLVLRQIFPAHVVELLKTNQPVPPEVFKSVSVLFADVESFTTIASSCSALQTHHLLNELYLVIDQLLARFPRLYKVETIGDSIMVVSGAPTSVCDSLDDLVQFAVLVQNVIPRVMRHPITGVPVNIRIGMHTGEVVGGVVGSIMPRYTFSGDTVNMAARMQTLSYSNGILISAPLALQIAKKFGSAAQVAEISNAGMHGLDSDITFDFSGRIRLTSRGLQDVKGKGQCQTFTLHQLRTDDAPTGERQLHKTPSTKSLFRATSGGRIQVTPPPTPHGISQPFKERLKATFELSELQELLDGDNLLSNDCPSSGPASDPTGTSSYSGDEDIVPFELGEEGFLGTVLSSSSVRKSSEGALVLPSDVLDGMSVLIVEDSNNYSWQLCRLFKKLNPSLTVETVSNLSEVQTTLTSKSFAFDMLLMNMTMAEHMDGTVSLKQLKAKYPSQMRRIITVLYASDCSENELAAISATADAFMAAPLPTNETVLQARIVQMALAKAWRRTQRKKNDHTSKLSDRGQEGRLQRLESALDLSAVQSALGVIDDDDGFLLGKGTSLLESSTSMPSPPTTSSAASSDDSAVRTFPPRLQARRQVSEPKLDALIGDNGGTKHLPSSTKGLRVVVVEDSHAQRKLLIRRLQECDESWQVVGVQDGTDCIRYLRANDCQADILLVDYNLGEEMTGADLVKELRTSFGMTRQLFIGLNRERSNIEGGFVACGADTAWSKPLPYTEIIRSRIDKLLAARRMLVALDCSTASGL